MKRTTQELKQAIERGKELHSKAEGRMEELIGQKKAIEQEMADLGVEPSNIGEEIQKAKQEMDSIIQEVENVIPQELFD